MSSKNVALREDVYRKLLEAKGQNESFSDVIEALLERKGSLLPLWNTLSASEGINIIEKESEEIRKGAIVRK